MSVVCICEGTTGHSVNCPLFINVTQTPFNFINKGWECPKCGSCFAPFVTKCTVCGPTTWTYTSGLAQNPK